jgi:hypothetical protein
MKTKRLSILLLLALGSPLMAEEDPCSPIEEVCVEVQGRIFCGRTPEAFSAYGPVVYAAAEKAFKHKQQRCEESRKKKQAVGPLQKAAC